MHNEKQWNKHCEELASNLQEGGSVMQGECNIQITQTAYVSQHLRFDDKFNNLDESFTWSINKLSH